jgi:type III restriction enzyme
VLAKKKAAETWCAYASGHNAKNGGKTWKYLLISHDQVQDNMTLAYYAQREGI